MDVARIGGSAGSPPVSRQAWSRLRPFALCGLVALALVPVAGTVTWGFVGAATAIAVALMLAITTWPRLALGPRQERVAFVVLIALGLLRHGVGGATGGYAVLVLLPVLWVGLYGDRTAIWRTLAGVAVLLTAPLVLIGGEHYPATGWRSAPLLVLCAAAAGIVVHGLLTRERAAARRRARLMGVIGDGVIVTDRHGSVREVNAALCRLTGFADHELLGQRPPLPGWPPDRHEALLEALTQAVMHGGGSIETPLFRKDGTEIFVVIAIAADAEGSVIATVKDVTEQVRLREQLRAERDRSVAIVETMQEGFGITRDGLIVEVNPALCRLTGFTRDQLVGAAQPYPFWPPGLEEEHGEGSHEVVYRRADGSHFFAELTTVALHDAAGRPEGHLNTVRDVSERKRHDHALRERGHQLAALAGMTRALAHAEPAEARVTVCETAVRIAGADSATIWEADAQGVLSCTSTIGAEPPAFTLGPDLPRDPARRAFQTGLATFIADAATSPTCHPDRVRALDSASAHFQPIVSEGRIAGVLALSWRAPQEALGGNREQLLELLAHEAGYAIARARAHARLELQARTDALTGLPNRRAFEERFAAELASARRTGRPLCVALLDLDRFKAYNDAHGHPAGDRLLRAVSDAWSLRLRETDLLARWGGEEFCLLLPGCIAADAVTLLDERRALVPEGQTVSAGVAELRPGEDAAAMLARADRALYDAKRGGRDRVVLAGRALDAPGVA